MSKMLRTVRTKGARGMKSAAISIRLFCCVLLLGLGAITTPSVAHAQNPIITCASDDMGYHTCDIGPNHGARVARQHSDAQCVEGQTFGVRGDQIWVNRGCRAEFEILPGR